jgi:hypothetical protein
MKPPGSRAKSVCTCQGLRPRRFVRVLALAHPNMLPSAICTRRHREQNSFRGSMAGLCVPLPTLRPQASRLLTLGSGPMWIATPSSSRTCTDCSLPVFPAHSDRVAANTYKPSVTVALKYPRGQRERVFVPGARPSPEDLERSSKELRADPSLRGFRSMLLPGLGLPMSLKSNFL